MALGRGAGLAGEEEEEPRRNALWARRALPCEVEVLESIYLDELQVSRGRSRYGTGPAVTPLPCPAPRRGGETLLPFAWASPVPRTP